jgi:hypothetical protein
MPMHWRSFGVIALFLFASLLPIMSGFSNAEHIFESTDAPENIPTPSNSHNITPITINACEPKNCVLDSSASDFVEINGNFLNSEDKDVYWINSNSTIKNITYEVCINSSTVAISINPYFRNPVDAWLKTGDTLGGSLISETPTINSICKKYPMLNEINEEFWIKISSLSTSGNYSIIIKSQQINVVGQEFNENLTHIMYSNKGVSVNSSMGPTSVKILNHSIDEGQLWNLEILSDSPHTIHSVCNMLNGNSINCFEKNSSFFQNSHSTTFNYYSPLGIESIEIILEMELWLGNWQVKNSLEKKGDPFMGNGGDAPGNLTTLQCELNNCKEFIANSGLTYTGSMPLGVFDEADVWILNINGNDSETFLIEIQLLCDSGSIMLELHSPNLNGTTNITYIVPTTSTWNTLQAEVSPDTHYIRLINIRLGNEQTWDFGDLNQPTTHYELQIKWIKNQTSLNQNFEVSEELLFWDNILLWFMGICFISPMIWVLFNIRKDRLRMELLMHDRTRLARLRNITSTSEINEVRSDLSVFIRALTKLDWDILLETWGEPDLSHVTESISIHSWRLDSKLANDGNTPLLINIETHQTDWEIAALKFESTNNLEWEIVSLQPNLLYRNHEVFLDTIKVGNKVILEVEIKGEGADVQMHISGMSNGTPVAIKTPNSMSCFEEE